MQIDFGAASTTYSSLWSLLQLRDFVQKTFALNGLGYTLMHRQSQTEIDTDSDLLALKYSVLQRPIRIQVVLKKTPKQLEMELISGVVADDLNCLYEQVINQIEHRAEQEACQNYLCKLYGTVADQYFEEQATAAEINNYITDLYLRTSSMCLNYKIVQAYAGKPCRRARTDISTNTVNEDRMEWLVNEKIKGLIPTLVDKIYERVRRELQSGCTGCRQKAQFEKLISKEVQRRCKATEDSSDSEMSNPQMI